VLTFTTLYPNAAQPQHGVFVEQRLLRLVDAGLQAEVCAPVPWFPLAYPMFGDYARFARAPYLEMRHGLRVLHPRYPVVPKFGMSIAPWLLYRAMQPVFKRSPILRTDFDIIDAHYFYPDGVAATWLGHTLRKPVVITARGSDINLLARFPRPRRMIRCAAHACAAIVTVSAALRAELLNLGVAAGKIHVIRNGVDLHRFRPLPRDVMRRQLRLNRRTLLCIGKLVPSKGQELVIAALKALPDWDLLLVGEGPQRAQLEEQCRRLEISERVRFLGSLPQDELPALYSAADILVLASEREGLPNVVLEAMACGTPVLAAAVGGVPEVVTAPAAGRLLTERSSSAIVGGILALHAERPSRSATREYAEQYGWASATAAQLALYEHVQRVAVQ